jgi:hypothetical protein
MNILTKISESYLSPDYEPIGKILSYDSAKDYFRQLLVNQNIVYLLDNTGELVAWMEIWILDEEQTKRVVLDKDDKFCPLEEDILDGDVYYIADLFIAKGSRGDVETILKLWKMGEKVHGKKKIITFERNRLDNKFRVFKGGG